jgi:GTPase Era involved in 16S rRNA processing
MEQVLKKIYDIDRNYFSVAIIGVQNSGKSTLLNNLFGTKFNVLQ